MSGIYDIRSYNTTSKITRIETLELLLTIIRLTKLQYYIQDNKD